MIGKDRNSTSGSLFLAACLSAVFSFGCGEPALDDETPSHHEAPESTSGSVRLYYTKKVEGKTVVESTDISQAEADEILRARREQRPLSKAIGSSDWNNACRWWEWTLVTSASNGAGSIFCATDDGSTVNPVMIPFVPRFVSPSAYYQSALCTEATGCWYGCQGASLNAWSIYNIQGSDTNISPPSTVRYLSVHVPFWC